MTEASAFIGLFLSAFLAATLIPAQSEIGLGYLVINTDYSMVLLVTVASLGNTAGATINWFIGRGVAKISREFKKNATINALLDYYKLV